MVDRRVIKFCVGFVVNVWEGAGVECQTSKRTKGGELEVLMVDPNRTWRWRRHKGTRKTTQPGLSRDRTVRMKGFQERETSV